MTDETKLLTNAELDEMEVSLHREAARAGDLEPPFVSAKLALRLVGDLRRVRSDEWPKAAAHEIRQECCASDPSGTALWAGPDQSDEEVIAAIIWKHRDGRS